MSFKSCLIFIRRYFTIFILALILTMPLMSLFPFNFMFSSFPNNIKTHGEDSGVDSILWKIGKGLPGTGATMQPRLVNFSIGGEKFIIVGTDEGIAAVTLNGLIQMSYRTFGDVINFDIIEDISGDLEYDIVLITYDQEYANLMAITSNNGSEIWKYKPTIEGIDPTTYEAHNFITNTWDIKTINDINGDSISDIVISSWFRLIVVSGKDGNELWMNNYDFTNDIWKIEILEDINNNGFETIIAGSEEGKLGAFDSRDGTNIWMYNIEKTSFSVYAGLGIGTQEVPNSIDDIKIVNDVNGDNIDDILIATDEGYLRLISGLSHEEIDNAICFNMANITTLLSTYELTISPYTSIKRVFMKSGIKIYEIPDINNDGLDEFLSIACDLDYTTPSQYLIYGKIFNIFPGTGVNNINITTSLNWTCEDFYFGSYPEIVNSSSGIKIYFYSLEEGGWGAKSSVVKWYSIDDEASENATNVYEDDDQINFYFNGKYTSEKEEGHYLLNVGDINADGEDDLFAISANGRYLLIDCKNVDTIWVKTKETYEIELTEIQDLNGDGLEDFLIKKKIAFEPSWISQSDSFSMDEQITETQIINELFTIDAKTGNVIWTLSIPSTQYYEGLMDLLNIGDIGSDGIDDYAAWIIPSEIPTEITNILKELAEEETIPSDGVGTNEREKIYRALLCNYIKLLAINGSNGIIFWTDSLIDFPYKFYRHYEYDGTYEDPIDVESGDFHIYNRLNSIIGNSLDSNYGIEWDYVWNISELLHPDTLQIEHGESSGNIEDLWDSNGNYSIKAEPDGGSWKAILNLTIPLNFNSDNSLGSMEYQLSQIERFSALKMQTNLMVNTSNSYWYNFTYEIYNATGDEWVLCNWSQYDTWNNHTYPDLHGNFDDTDRSNYTYFDLTNDYKYDHMWVITRGTYDADPCVEFDYENKTTLSNFIDSNHKIRIRINVTNGNEPFNLTIGSFGVGAFYWGLFSNQYDRYYIWDYDSTDSYKFIEENLLNLEIQSFEVINGTGDEFFDVIAVIGIEGLSGDTSKWSARLRLFDIKNEQDYTKWSLNQVILPNKYVQALPLNNSLNSFILSGCFQFGTTKNCSHKLIKNPYWNFQITNFDNYSDLSVKIDYAWEIIPALYIPYSSDYLYEFPGKTIISKDGKIGIITGEYGWTQPYEWDPEYEEYSLTYLNIYDINNHSIASKIPTNNLNSYVSLISIGSIDFSLEGAGYKLLISYEDFNGDNYLDHVGLYDYSTELEMDYTYGTEIIVYSGNSGASNPIVLFKKLFEETTSSSSATTTQTKLIMPIASIEDCNNDGFHDAIIGLQARSYGGPYNSYKGSSISFYDIYNSVENNPIELTGYYWELDSYSSLYPGDIPYEFINSIEKIGDINGDNKSEIIINRNRFIASGLYYNTIPVIEILDVINRATLYSFNIDVDSIYPIIDLNEDEKNEILITSGELILCINSKFGIQILNPINEQMLPVHNFNLEWNTDSNFDYFEVLVNGTSQGPTTSKTLSVSLSSGWKQISIIMYDTSGLITAVNTINVFIAPNYIHLIITFVILGVVVGLYIFYKRFHKKEKELILINNKIKEGGKK